MKYLVVFLFLLLCNSAHAVVFEAYKESLENDLLCKSLPQNIDMHKQFLKESGVISSKVKKDKNGISYHIIM